MLLMLDEATSNGARLVWAGADLDTAKQLEGLRSREFKFEWQ